MNMKLNKTFAVAAGLLFAALSSAQWNQYHGNAQRTGLSSVNGPTSLNLSWTADIGGPVVTSPVLGPDGTIYLGQTLEDAIVPKTVMTAVNPDGSIKWRFRTPFVDHDINTFSTPAVGADGTVYFGSTEG